MMLAIFFRTAILSSFRICSFCSLGQVAGFKLSARVRMRVRVRIKVRVVWFWVGSRVSVLTLNLTLHVEGEREGGRRGEWTDVGKLLVETSEVVPRNAHVGCEE
jgi:hypothetical protein